MNEVEKKVKIGLWRQRIGYGSSDFACNLIWQMISLYLLYFYTNVMHLNAGAVSVMFLVTKVIDGISDLIVGFLIDKTNTKWGKSRPWILFGAIPFGVAAVLAFSVPNIGQTGMLIYAYVSYILLSTAYTVVNIPMASILPALSEDPHERTVLASCRTFFSSIGSTVVSAFALTLVDKFGNGNEALGFRIVMMIFGVIGCLVFFFCFFNRTRNDQTGKSQSQSEYFLSASQQTVETFCLEYRMVLWRICNPGKCSYLLLYLCCTEYNTRTDRSNHYDTGADRDKLMCTVPGKTDIEAKPDGWRKFCTYGWSSDHLLWWHKCSCSSGRCSDRSSRIRTEGKYAFCNAA